MCIANFSKLIYFKSGYTAKKSRSDYSCSVAYKSNAAYISALKLACIGFDVQSHNQSNRTIIIQSCQVYCFLGIFPFFYIKFRASEFFQLIPIIYNHKILEESNKHAAVGSEV